MGPVHIILLVLGILLCLAGMFILARDGGFFSVWFFGSAYFWLYGFHEGFDFIIYTGNYGPYDRTLSFIGIGIMLASFVLYLYSEVKFVYLAYLVDEALSLNENKKYKQACISLNCKRSPCLYKAHFHRGSLRFSVIDCIWQSAHYGK